MYLESESEKVWVNHIVDARWLISLDYKIYKKFSI